MNPMEIIGEMIGNERKKQKLSQKQLAEGICSQPMISQIEKGHYTPNGILLMKLCQRLAIKLETTMLSDFYHLTEFEEFSQLIEEKCRNHDYVGMLKVIDNSNLEPLLKESRSLQVYYYYYGCALYQGAVDKQGAIRYFKLALVETFPNRQAHTTVIERLLLSGLGVMSVNRQESLAYFDEAFVDLASVPYEENLNVLFYQRAYDCLQHGELVAAFHIIEQGIDFITRHNSHYMLTNLLHLAYKCIKNQGDEGEQKRALHKFQVVKDLFREPVYEFN